MDITEKIRHFDLKSGDTLVLSIESSLSQSAIDRVRRQFKEIYPENKLLILENGLTVDSILKTESKIAEK